MPVFNPYTPMGIPLRPGRCPGRWSRPSHLL